MDYDDYVNKMVFLGDGDKSINLGPDETHNRTKLSWTFKSIYSVWLKIKSFQWTFMKLLGGW